MSETELWNPGAAVTIENDVLRHVVKPSPFAIRLHSER